MVCREKIVLRIAVPVALALLFAACATTPAEQPVSVTGSITYRERIALPPTAQVEITLGDVSLADAPSKTIARQAFTADGRQAPFPFTMTVDQRPLDPRHSYAVSARITDASGRLMFITDTRNSVAFDGRRTIDMGMLTLVKTN